MTHNTETIIYAAAIIGLILIIVLAAALTASFTDISASTQIHAALTTSDIATDAEIREADWAEEDCENENIEAALLEKASVIENCTVTHYAVCVACCGNDNGITASGIKAVPYVSVAVDPSIIPLGSDVLVDYGDGEINYYKADDTGSGVTGGHIDLCVEDYETAKEMGVKTATVYYIPPVEVEIN